MGAPRALALCFNFGGALAFQAGRWSEAEKNLRDAVRLYGEVGSASGESLSLQRLGVLLTARGEIEQARKVLGDGVVIAERAAMRSHCLTRLHASMIRNRLAADDREGVEASLAEGLEAARRHGKCITCNALLLPEVVRAHLYLDDVDAAEENAARLARTAAHFDSQVWTAMAAQVEGRVQLARGSVDQAFTSFQRAREGYLAVAQPYEAARCLVSQAACLRAGTRDKGAALRASELERQAREAFSALGTPGAEELHRGAIKAAQSFG
jgi:tetratricopeptide (TPR) repeat protein